MSELLSKGPVATDRALAITAQLAAALRDRHARGAAHLGVRPAALRVEAGAAGPVVTLLEPDGATDAPYVAPEQWRGGAVGPAADVYAAGAVLWALLRGAAPPESRTAPPTPPAALAGPLRQVLACALDADPARRPSAAALLADLLAAHAAVTAPAETASAHPRGKIVALATAAVLLAGSVGLVIVLRMGPQRSGLASTAGPDDEATPSTPTKRAPEPTRVELTGRTEGPDGAPATGRANEPTTQAGPTGRAAEPTQAPAPTGRASEPTQAGDPDRASEPLQVGDTGRSSEPTQAGDPGRASEPQQVEDTGRSGDPQQVGDTGRSGEPQQVGDTGRASEPQQVTDTGRSSEPATAPEPTGRASEPTQVTDTGRSSEPATAPEPTGRASEPTQVTDTGRSSEPANPAPPTGRASEPTQVADTGRSSEPANPAPPTGRASEPANPAPPTGRASEPANPAPPTGRASEPANPTAPTGRASSAPAVETGRRPTIPGTQWHVRPDGTEVLLVRVPGGPVIEDGARRRCEAFWLETLPASLEAYASFLRRAGDGRLDELLPAGPTGTALRAHLVTDAPLGDASGRPITDVPARGVAAWLEWSGLRALTPLERRRARDTMGVPEGDLRGGL